MNISIFGLGYVGCVSLGCLAKNGHKVIGVDVSDTKVKLINSGKPTIIEKQIAEIIEEAHQNDSIRAPKDSDDAVAHSDLSIIAVGTPSTANGHLDLKYIYKVGEQIGRALQQKESFHTVAIRSTVLPGTCDRLADIIAEHSGKIRNRNFAVVDNPEFLREGSAVKDYYNPPITLIGSDNREAAQTVASLYRELPAEVIICDLKVAEIMKYVNNTFHALKISFANEVGNICSELDIDSHKVMEILCKDKQLNISPYYMKPGFAYGGSCLPKDLQGFQTIAHDNYVKAPLINSISNSNEEQISRAIKLLDGYLGKNIGILGLSFKAGTDDLRNSPSVRLVEALLGKGAKLSIYDRNLKLSMLTGTNRDYIEARIPHLSSLMLDDVEKVIENTDVLVVTTPEKEFVDSLIAVQDKTIIDLVRLGDDFLEKANYVGINWNFRQAGEFVSNEDTVLS